MEDFNIEQLTLSLTIILGSLSACLMVIFKSRCKRVKCCCIEIDREIIKDIEDIELQPTNDQV